MRRLAVCLIIALIASILPSASAQKVDAYHYFSTRLERINDQLHLTDDQIARLKPMIEQETALMGQVYKNPVLSQKEKLKKYWAIINATNGKIGPMLNGDQLAAFADVKKVQKAKYEELMREAKKGS